MAKKKQEETPSEEIFGKVIHPGSETRNQLCKLPSGQVVFLIGTAYAGKGSRGKKYGIGESVSLGGRGSFKKLSSKTLFVGSDDHRPAGTGSYERYSTRFDGIDGSVDFDDIHLDNTRAAGSAKAAMEKAFTKRLGAGKDISSVVIYDGLSFSSGREGNNGLVVIAHADYHVGELAKAMDGCNLDAFGHGYTENGVYGRHFFCTGTDVPTLRGLAKALPGTHFVAVPSLAYVHSRNLSGSGNDVLRTVIGQIAGQTQVARLIAQLPVGRHSFDYTSETVKTMGQSPKVRY